MEAVGQAGIALPTQRQLDLLAKEDPRFHTIGPGGTGLVMLATTERRSKLSNKLVSFGLPSAPALYLNLAQASHRQREAIDLDEAFHHHPAPQGIWPEDHRTLFDYFEAFAAEIIFSYTAVEAFANECIPETFEFTVKAGRKGEMTLRGAAIERQVPLGDKLALVIPKAHNLKSLKGSKPWQDFRDLEAARNRLIHLKSLDRRASGPEDQTIWGLMLTQKKTWYAQTAYRIIGSFPPLVAQRRWHKEASKTFE